jgi:hypothetical protein
MIYNAYQNSDKNLLGISIVSGGHIFAEQGRSISRPEGREDYLLFYVAKGSEHLFLDKETELSEGGFIFFRPHEKHHSTVTDAAREAQSLGIENLVLYHMEDTHLVGRADRVTEEAARVFCGQTFSPYDLDTIEID